MIQQASQARCKPIIWPLMALLVLGLSGCRNDRVDVNKKDPDSPQYAYRKDELALLQMSADDIQELERKKQYGTIYDDYASEAFKQGVGRRRFMIMSNCVESFLGDVEEYDRNDIGFRRDYLKDKRNKPTQNYVDVLNRKVQRTLGSIEEQMVFVPNGLSFKLNGLYWIAKDKHFLQCIGQSESLDQQTAPKPEVPAAGTEPSTEVPATNASGETKPATETGAQPGSVSEPIPSGASTGGPVPEPATGTEAKPIHGLKQTEIKKQTIQARPAGAGAVVDSRPLPKKTREERKTEDTSKERIEPEEPIQGTVPLPTTGGSDD